MVGAWHAENMDMHMPRYLGRQRRAIDPLELDLEEVVSHLT